MVKKGYLILFLILPLLASSQEGEKKPFRIEGKIVDSLQRPVSYAHILIKSRNTGWVGGYDGTFRIGVYPGDTITISAISYQKKQFIIMEGLKEKDQPLLFLMDQDTILLKEQLIYPWPETYSELKKEILQMEADHSMDAVDLHLPSLKDLDVLARTPMVEGQMGLYSGPGPFSVLYYHFSKEAKSKKMLHQIRLKDQAETRYNAALVSRITGLSDDEEIEKLMEFCDLQVQFILNSTDYELYSAIMYCYKDYSAK